mgnify:CR=1 FL=1
MIHSTESAPKKSDDSSSSDESDTEDSSLRNGLLVDLSAADLMKISGGSTGHR